MKSILELFYKKNVLLYEILREYFQFRGFIHVKNAEKRFFTPNTVQKSARLLERLFNVTRSFDFILADFVQNYKNCHSGVARR